MEKKNSPSNDDHVCVQFLCGGKATLHAYPPTEATNHQNASAVHHQGQVGDAPLNTTHYSHTHLSLSESLLWDIFPSVSVGGA